MEERRGKDVIHGGSIDHTRSHLNEYWVCDAVAQFANDNSLNPYSGDTVCEYIQQTVDDYSLNVYKPKNKKALPRETVIQAISVIVKPEAREIQMWDDAKRKRFFDLSAEYLDEVFGGKKNLIAYAEHRDEGFVDMHGEFFEGRHQHRLYMPWTEGGRLCAKEIHGGPLWKNLNAGYPAFMREHGFDMEDTLILDYDEVMRIDDAIKKADTQEEVDALEAEKQALRDEANAERDRRREERGGLPYGSDARRYANAMESSLRLAEMEQSYSIAAKAALDAEIDKEVLVESMEQTIKELDSEYAIIEGQFRNAVDMRKEADEARLKACAERDDAIVERDAAVTERDAAVTERDAAIAERDAAIAERDKALRKQLDKSSVLVGIEAEISMKRKSADKDLDTYKAEQYEKINSDIAAEKQRRIDEAVGLASAALAAREKSLEEDEEKLARDKVDFDKTRSRLQARTDEEWSKAAKTAFDAQQELRRVNEIAYEYEQALAAASDAEDPAIWQAKRLKAPDKYRQESGNASATWYDWLVDMANGSGGREFQERHERFLAGRGNVNDAEARVQEIIKRAADGKKSRGFEVGEWMSVQELLV